MGEIGIYVSNGLQHTLLLKYLYDYRGFVYLDCYWYWKFINGGVVWVDICKKLVTGGCVVHVEDKSDITYYNFFRNIWMLDAINMGVL